MKLVAIFCKGHYLFKDDTLINLGGKYLYHISLNDDQTNIKIERKNNNSYIKKFFGNKISLLSSIVGSNGSGKTSLINSILLNINNTSIGIIDCEVIVLIFENNKKVDVVFHNYTESQIGIKAEGFTVNTIGDKIDNISTIFYTPMLDIRELYINFTNAHFTDISKYRLFQDDTEDEEGSFTQLAEFHLSENLKRWLQFNEKFGSSMNTDFDEVPKFDQVNIVINRVFSLMTDFHDTSYDFRDFAKFFYKKWQDEFHADNVSNQKRLQLNLILSVIEKTFNILEKTGNTYLQEGKVKVKVSDLEVLGLKDSFYAFLDNHFFEKFEDVFLPVDDIKSVIEILISNVPVEEDIRYNKWDEYSVDFNVSFKIIEVYQSFIKSFSQDFTLDKTIMLTFKPNVDISTGEKGLLDLFASYYSLESDSLMENLLIFIDEGDTSFHPEWKKKYINSLVKYLPKIFDGKRIQIILTTHDAFTLSDIPTNNIVYLKKENNERIVLQGDDRPKKSFGANITDLLSDSFFINDGLMGDFAKEKINKVIELLNTSSQVSKSEKIYMKKVIDIIDEPLIKTKLKEKYYIKFPEDFNNEKEIEILNEQAKKLGFELKRI